MKHSELVAVTSRSFSKNLLLRHRLQEHFSSVKFNEEGLQLTDNTLKNFLQGAKRAIIGLEIIDAKLLDYLPDLKAICKVGTGIDKIDMAELKKRKISFAHTPGVNKRSVSELVLGLIFTLLRNFQETNHLLKNGTWKQLPGKLLSNKIVGIIGFGIIGKDLARILSIFDCQCLIYDVQTYADLPSHVRQVSLEELLHQSDVISIHIPLIKENYHFLGENELAKMKETAILINTARGGLINEDALYHALQNKQIAAAALDVFEHEPHIPHQLLKLNNFFATSHIGGSTNEAIEAMGMMAIDKLLSMEIN